MPSTRQLRIRDRRRAARRARVRRQITGTAQRPRLATYRSNRFLYVQLIDDAAAKTLVAASTRDPDCQPSEAAAKSLEAARLLGEKVAKLALDKGVEAAVFDRRHYRYHGRMKALADAAREAGLKL